MKKEELSNILGCSCQCHRGGLISMETAKLVCTHCQPAQQTFTQEEERLFDEAFRNSENTFDYCYLSGQHCGLAVSEFKLFIRAHDQRLLERIREWANQGMNKCEHKEACNDQSEAICREHLIRKTKEDLLTFLKEMEK